MSDEGGGGEPVRFAPRASSHLLVITDGLAEPPSAASTLERSPTPVLDRMSASGVLCRIDPQGGVPAEQTTSERGISTLLGAGGRGAGLLPRASLLSFLACGSGDAGEISPASWFFLATPVLFDRERRLVRYVNDRVQEHAFWTTFLERFPEHPHCRMRAIRKADGRIERMLLALSAPPSRHLSGGNPPRAGLSESFSGFSPDFSYLLHRTPDCEELLQGGNYPGKRDDPEFAINGLWLWGGGPSLPSGLFSGPGGESPEADDRWIVADTLLVRALGCWAGYRNAPLRKSTGDVDTDLGEKMAEVLRRIRGGASRVVLHLEGFDMASHRKDIQGKSGFLQRVDREVFAPVEEWLNAGLLTSVRITSDHQSSPVTGNHESGPVPALFLHRNGCVPEGFVSWKGNSSKALPASRMTEREALSRPLVPVDEWNMWPDLDRNGRANPNDGKDLCLALS